MPECVKSEKNCFVFGLTIRTFKLAASSSSVNKKKGYKLNLVSLVEAQFHEMSNTNTTSNVIS